MWVGKLCKKGRQQAFGQQQQSQHLLLLLSKAAWWLSSIGSAVPAACYAVAAFA
jgi:hypothetical protein